VAIKGASGDDAWITRTPLHIEAPTIAGGNLTQHLQEEIKLMSTITIRVITTVIITNIITCDQPLANE